MSRQHKYQRVVFVEPKSTHIHVYSTVHIPRIGSILLATMLKKRGYDVTVIIEDMLKKRVTENDIWRKIKEADLLCISSITSTVNRCYAYGDRARALGIPTIIGGTHVSYFPDEAIEHADYVMRGEADESFLLLMEILEADGDLTKAPGLTWRKASVIRHNPEPKLPAAAVLEANPAPDYALLWETNLRGGVFSIAAARGCPFDCSFCSVTKFNGALVRAISAARTLDIIEEHWRAYKPHYIFFAEDIFNLQKKRAKEIMRGLVERKIRPAIGFGAQMRHEVARDDEFLALMKEAKFDRAMVGFESINQASLDLCGKREKVENIRFAMERFHKFKIKVHGMFVAGFDTDTPQTFHDTLKFVRACDLDSFQMMLLTPLPGTRDWHHEGFADGTRPLLSKDWSQYDGHHALQIPKLMTPYEANFLALQTMRNFYSLPRAIRRLLKGDWVEFLMRLSGRHLIRRWFETPENRAYLESLKKQLERKEPRFSALVRRVMIAHTEGSLVWRERLTSFFNALGVRVENLQAGSGELLERGGVTLIELKYLAAKFRPGLSWIKREEADLILVPADRGNEIEIDLAEVDGETPVLVHLNINRKAGVLAQQCVQIAARYTGSLVEAAEVFRRTMVDPPALEVVRVK